MAHKIEQLTTSADELLANATVSASLGATVNREVGEAAELGDARVDKESHAIEVGETSVEGVKEDIYSRPVSPGRAPEARASCAKRARRTDGHSCSREECA